MGASSFSPSPMTMTPSIDTDARTTRMASVAAPSADSFSPRPIHRADARAAASVTRTSSMARLRSGGWGWALMGRTLYRQATGVRVGCGPGPMILYCPRCGNELAQRVKGEWFESATPCGACGLVLTEPPLVLAPDPDDEVEYALDSWGVPERAAATAALAEVDIPYRWEEGLVLVVPGVAEDEVDVLLEELEAPDELDADEGGDGEDGDEE